MENIQPVQTPETAGTQEGVVETPINQPAPVDLQAVSDLLDESDKTLEKVERKIIDLKRRIKSGDEFGDDDLRSRLETAEAELSQLRDAKKLAEDTDVSEIQAIRKRNAELRASLIAKATVSNTSSGSNQDELKPEEDLTKSISGDELPVLEGYAKKYNLTLKEVKAAQDASSVTNQPLGLYLRQLKRK